MALLSSSSHPNEIASAAANCLLSPKFVIPHFDGSTKWQKIQQAFALLPRLSPVTLPKLKGSEVRPVPLPSFAEH